MNAEIFKRLREHSFLQTMPDEYLYLIADCAEHKQFFRDTLLMQSNQAADVFYLTLKGRVCLRMPTLHGAVPIETVSAPAALGWSWLVPPYKWQYDALALDEVNAIVVHTPCIHAKVENDRAFGCEIYRRFIELVVDRLHGAQMQMMDIYAKPDMGVL